MIRRFLNKLNKNKKKQERNLEFEAAMTKIFTGYKISEVELEVLRQGNRSIQILGNERYSNLVLKKKVNCFLEDRRINVINEALGEIKFEIINGKLYLFENVDMFFIRSFTELKERIEDFKRKYQIIKDIIFND